MKQSDLEYALYLFYEIIHTTNFNEAWKYWYATETLTKIE